MWCGVVLEGEISFAFFSGIRYDAAPTATALRIKYATRLNGPLQHHPMPSPPCHLPPHKIDIHKHMFQGWRRVVGRGVASVPDGPRRKPSQNPRSPAGGVAGVAPHADPECPPLPLPPPGGKGPKTGGCFHPHPPAEGLLPCQLPRECAHMPHPGLTARAAAPELARTGSSSKDRAPRCEKSSRA